EEIAVVLFARSKAFLRRCKCLGAMAAVVAAGALVISPAVPATAATSVAEQFSPVYGGQVTLEDYNTEGGLFAIIGNFSSVYTFPCEGSIEQVWNLYSTPFDGWNFVNQSNHQCLDSNDSGDDYTDSCDWNNEHQSWTFGGEGPATTIQNQATTLCLDSDD